MPSLITFNMITCNSPQQNSGTYIGEVNINGLDANQKQNAGQTGTYGLFIVNGNFNFMFDGNEVFDSPIIDADVKSSLSGQV
jgi:hypothetical protein